MAPTMTRLDANRRRGRGQGVTVVLILFIGSIYLVALHNMLWLTDTERQNSKTAAMGPSSAARFTTRNQGFMAKESRVGGENETKEVTHGADSAPLVASNIDATLRANRTNYNASPAHSIFADNNVTVETPPWPGSLDHLIDSKNRIIILIATCPYLEMLDNVVRSMLQINVSNFALVPLDDTTFTVASKLYPNHTVSIPPFAKVDSNAAPAEFGSKEFQTLTASRPIIISAFLRQNYTVFYTDTDTVWNSNPLDIFQQGNEECDLVGMTDNPFNQETCSCYLYFQPTTKSFAMLNRWNQLIQTKRFQHDQIAFHRTYLQVKNTTRVKLFEPGNPYFPNGKSYFEKFNETQRAKVAMIHNNFVFGYEQKKKRFIQHDLWHPSLELLEMNYTC